MSLTVYLFLSQLTDTLLIFPMLSQHDYFAITHTLHHYIYWSASYLVLHLDLVINWPLARFLDTSWLVHFLFTIQFVIRP